MDPHFAIPLVNGLQLCYSLQGISYFIFNLISDPLININAYFIPPEEGKNLQEYATFLGDVGVMIKSPKCFMAKCEQEIITKVKISAAEKSVLVDGRNLVVKDKAVHVVTGMDVRDTAIEFGEIFKKKRPYVIIELKQSGLAFKFQFTNEHLDLIVLDYSGISKNAHGIMGRLTFLHIVCMIQVFPTAYVNSTFCAIRHLLKELVIHVIVVPFKASILLYIFKDIAPLSLLKVVLRGSLQDYCSGSLVPAESIAKEFEIT